jgi:hypothetical protein
MQCGSDKMKSNLKAVIITLGSIILIFVVLPMTLGYKISYYKEVELDYNLANIIVQFLGVSLSGLLSYKIINQTNKIANMQMIMEQNSTTTQEQLQKKQLKIDLFDRRFAVFEDLLRIFSYTSLLVKPEDKEDPLQNKIDSLLNIYSALKEEYDIKSNVFTLYSAEFLFNGELLEAIKKILKLYTEMNSQVTILKIFNENIPLKQKEETYIVIMECCKAILSHQSYIDERGKAELNIAEFEK